MFRCTWRRLPHFLLSCLFALGLLLGGLTSPAQAALRSPALATLPQQPLVPQGSGPPTILLHGVGDHWDHLAGGCDGGTTWDRTKTWLQNRGFTYVYSLGFYINDYSCGDYLYQYEHQHQHCASYPDSNRSNDGTWDEDDRHVACALAWYIWDNFTQYGTPVNFVAHSLGGVLIKYALYRSGPNGHDYHFPPYLYVHQVVTFSSPLNGVDPGASIAVCQECWQIWELELGVNGGIHDELTSAAARGAQGAGGTNWTAEGQFNRGIGCDWTGPTAFEGISYGLKIDYSNPVWQSNPNLPGDNACQFPPGFGQWYYGHGTYLLDNTSTAYNVPVSYCTGCGGDPGTSANFSHSLQEMYLGLIGRCNILASTTTCDGTDPNQTGCSSSKTIPGGDPWYLTVYWGPHCNSNWALVYAPSGDLVTVTLARSPTASWGNVDRQFIYCAPSRTSCPTGTWATFGPYTTGWITDMLYAPYESVAVRITTTTGATYTSIWH